MRSMPWLSVAAGFTLLTVLDPSAALAQRGRGQVRDGNRLFDEGRYEEARQRYLDALREDPTSPIARFNEGDALYESAEFQEAADAYQRALATGDPAIQAKAWYNLGNALYRQQMLQESVEAYRQALRVDPTDPDAKHNLEWVLQQMEEQQQQDQSDQRQDQPQQDQQNQPQNENEDQQDQQQNQPQEDQQQGDAPSDERDNDTEQQQTAAEPPQMSTEDAERLLNAIEDNPNDVRRQPSSRVRAGRPKKPW